MWIGRGADRQGLGLYEANAVCCMSAKAPRYMLPYFQMEFGRFPGKTLCRAEDRRVKTGHSARVCATEVGMEAPYLRVRGSPEQFDKGTLIR